MVDNSDSLLILYGEGGCGKTSLLAKAASMCTSKDWFDKAKPINIIRFLGTTPDSSALTPTLISICQQVKSKYFQEYKVEYHHFRFHTISCYLSKEYQMILYRLQHILNSFLL
ncbi:hypothetical protein HHI36_021236 [Cryptolaemus montrouzieri]|uniref:Uncharacterized protein n=1 Tax=Cryptolaemus montrouzieri TaxID=559131 RepID=A0ABD2MW61_9CUCU